LYLCIVIPNVMGSLVAGYMADRVSQIRVIAIGTLALTASIPLVAVFHHSSQLGSFCVMVGLVAAIAAFPMVLFLGHFSNPRIS
jgi:predicted MFS family arabinose efflux permease